MHSTICPSCGGQVPPTGARECLGCLAPITEPILPNSVRPLARLAKLLVAAGGALGSLKALALMWRAGYRAAVVTIVMLAFVGAAVSEYQRRRNQR